jgi:hypothetical protein
MVDHFKHNSRNEGGVKMVHHQTPCQVKDISVLLDWCCCELFLFLAKVDERMAGADPLARASYLYLFVILPMYEISQQKAS